LLLQSQARVRLQIVQEKNVPPTNASVQVGPAITSAYVAAYNTINATTRNTFKTMRDGKHIAG